MYQCICGGQSTAYEHNALAQYDDAVSLPASLE
jgi:hypothetical protein